MARKKKVVSRRNKTNANRAASRAANRSLLNKSPKTSKSSKYKARSSRADRMGVGIGASARTRKTNAAETRRRARAAASGRGTTMAAGGPKTRNVRNAARRVNRVIGGGDQG